MAQVMFYHLTQRRLETVLSDLIGRALSRDWRVVVQGRDPARLARLDEALWTSSDDSFLPHGLAGGDHDAAQPVLLTLDDTALNGAHCLMSVDSAPFDPAQAAGYERTCILFDGLDEAALSYARGQWRQIKQAGIGAQYWSEESGRWEMKAEI